MKSAGASSRVWLLAGALLLLPLMGRMPAHRDLPGYFVPMRAWTAAELRAGHVPWLNPLNGCGESWFANPQTGVLYPPAWVWKATDAPWALSLEISFHLAVLAFGVGWLLWRLTEDPMAVLGGEVMALCAPPVLTLAGMLNNLETLAWVPWMVIAVRSRPRVRLLALPLVVAMGWLAAAPVVWACGLLVTILFAPRDRWTALAVGLGVLLAAVSLVPFIGWVLQGDRGPGASSAAMLAGAIAPRGWASLLVPGVPASGWAESLFLGGPLVAAAALRLRRSAGLMALLGALAALATLPSLGGGKIFLAVTGGLIRYPSRFAVFAVLGLALAAASGLSQWLRGGGRLLTAGIAVLTVAATLEAPPLAAACGAALAALLLAAAAWPSARWLRLASVGLSLVAAMIVSWGLLEPWPAAQVRALGSPWQEARGHGRVFVPLPDPPMRRRLGAEPRLRGPWTVGYTNLPAELATVRSDAPLEHAAVASLEQHAEGPRERWWLDVAGARWVVLPGSTTSSGLVPVRSEDGLWLHRNPSAWPLELLVTAPPRIGSRPSVAPGVVTVVRGPGRLLVATNCEAETELAVSLAPLKGWTWRVDGRVQEAVAGPAVLQRLQLKPGSHTVEGYYRPALLGIGAALSVIAVVLLLALAVVTRYTEVAP